MKRFNSLVWLVFAVVLFASAAATAGLFGSEGGTPFPFTTLHGETVLINGQGLYRYDTAFKAPILRGTDAVTLLVCLPLLVLATYRYVRGSLGGGLLLAGVLSYFLYNAASLAFGVAYNKLFILYIAYFSASLFAFILSIGSIDIAELRSRISSRLPHRAIAIFLFVAGLSVFVWLIEIVTALSTGGVPRGVASYTTEVTTILDIGVIAPAAFLAGLLVLRRASLGYLLAAILLVLNAIIGVVVVAQTVAQSLAGISLTTAELVVYVGVFVLMSLIATWLAFLLFRSIGDRGDGKARVISVKTGADPQSPSISGTASL